MGEVEVSASSLRKVEAKQEKVRFSATCQLVRDGKEKSHLLRIYYQPNDELMVLAALQSVGVDLRACASSVVELESPIREEQDIMLLPHSLFIQLDDHIPHLAVA